MRILKISHRQSTSPNIQQTTKFFTPTHSLRNEKAEVSQEVKFPKVAGSSLVELAADPPERLLFQSASVQEHQQEQEPVDHLGF